MKIKRLVLLYFALLSFTQCNTDNNIEHSKIPMLSQPTDIHIEAKWGLGVHEFAWYTKLVLSDTAQYIQTTGLKEKIPLNVSKEELLALYQPFFEEDFNTIEQPKGQQTGLVGVNSILLEIKEKEAGRSTETMLHLDMHAYLKPSENQQRFDTLSNFLKSWTTQQLNQQKVSCTIKFDPQFLEKAKPFYFRIGDYYDSYENEELMKTGKIIVDLLSGTNFYWIEWKKRPYLANKDGWLRVDAGKKELTFRLDKKGEALCQ